MTYPGQVSFCKLNLAVIQGSPCEQLLTLNVTDLEQVHAMTRPGSIYLYLLCIRSDKHSLLYRINPDFSDVTQDQQLPGAYNAAWFNDRYQNEEALILMLYQWDSYDEILDMHNITVYAWRSKSSQFELVTYCRSRSEIKTWYRIDSTMYIITADSRYEGVTMLAWNSSHLTEVKRQSSELQNINLTQSQVLDIVQHTGHVFLALEKELQTETSSRRVHIYKLRVNRSVVEVLNISEVNLDEKRPSLCKFFRYKQTLSLLVGVHQNSALIYKYIDRNDKFKKTAMKELEIHSVSGAAFLSVAGEHILLVAKTDFRYSSPAVSGPVSSTYVLSHSDP